MSNKPIRRLVYWDKATNQEYEIAAIFKGDKFDWKDDVQPSDGQTRNPQYPRMLGSEAFARAERKEGRIRELTPKSANEPKRDDSRGNGQHRAETGGGRYGGEGGFHRTSEPQGGGGDFGDDDIPFRQFDDRRA